MNQPVFDSRLIRLIVIALLALSLGAAADFSGRNGYGRIGFRGGYPISFGQPLASYGGFNFEEGEYYGLVNAALEGGIGFSDYLELTIAVNVEFAKWTFQPDLGDEVVYDSGTGSAVVGATAYFIKGDIRPYGRLDAGVSFHYGDDAQDAPGYIRSVGFGLGVGVGCQFVLGEVFYLEPYFHWRSHLNSKYDVEVDGIEFEPYEEDYEQMPMSLHAGLGFGFLF